MQTDELIYHLPAAHLRHDHIRHDDIDVDCPLPLLNDLQGLIAIGGSQHGITAIGQTFRSNLRMPLFVLNKQYGFRAADELLQIAAPLVTHHGAVNRGR